MLARSRLLGFLPPSGQGSISSGNEVWLALAGRFQRRPNVCSGNEVEAPAQDGPGAPARTPLNYVFSGSTEGTIVRQILRFERPVVEREDKREFPSISSPTLHRSFLQTET